MWQIEIDQINLKWKVFLILSNTVNGTPNGVVFEWVRATVRFILEIYVVRKYLYLCMPYATHLKSSLSECVGCVAYHDLSCSQMAASVVACILLSLVSATQPIDYCIVGAGPSGLQLGSLLGTAQRDYIIFERGNSSGSNSHDPLDKL